MPAPTVCRAAVAPRPRVCSIHPPYLWCDRDGVQELLLCLTPPLGHLRLALNLQQAGSRVQHISRQHSASGDWAASTLCGCVVEKTQCCRRAGRVCCTHTHTHTDHPSTQPITHPTHPPHGPAGCPVLSSRVGVSCLTLHGLRRGGGSGRRVCAGRVRPPHTTDGPRLCLMHTGEDTPGLASPHLEHHLHHTVVCCCRLHRTVEVLVAVVVPHTTIPGSSVRRGSKAAEDNE